MRIYVGIDIHRKFHEVAIIPESRMQNDVFHDTKTLKVSSNRADFEAIVAEIEQYHSDSVTVGIDHTGGHYSGPLLTFLYSKGYTIYYLEPKGFRVNKKNLLGIDNKTDALDSISMAVLLWMRDTTNKQLRFSTTKPEMNTLSSVLHPLIQQRWTMNKYKNQATNRLRHLLSSTFPEGEEQYFDYLLKILHLYPTPARMLEAGEKELVKAGLSKAKAAAIIQCAKTTIGIPAERYEEVIKIMTLQRQEAEQKVDTLTEQITKQIEEHPYARILMSFPAVNYIAAGTLLSVIGNIDNWKTKGALRKAMGIYPTVSASGRNAGTFKLGQEGSRDARRVLYQVIFTCLSPTSKDNYFRDYANRCKARGMSGKKAILAAAGVFIEVLFHCLKNNELYEYKSNGKQAGEVKA